jgi:hypothetical protein
VLGARTAQEAQVYAHEGVGPVFVDEDELARSMVGGVMARLKAAA